MKIGNKKRKKTKQNLPKKQSIEIETVVNMCCCKQTYVVGNSYKYRLIDISNHLLTCILENCTVFWLSCPQNIL